MAEERGDCNREMTVFLEEFFTRRDFASEAWDGAARNGTGRNSTRKSAMRLLELRSFPL
jgi:hypothetical protein